jgi:hypothetical protein
MKFSTNATISPVVFCRLTRFYPLRPTLTESHNTMSLSRLALILSLLITPVLSATTAQAEEKKVGRVGDFDIVAIFDKGKFDRCAASSKNGTGMLRLAFTKRHVYSLSIPGVKNSGKQIISLTFDNGATLSYEATGANDSRAWVALDDQSTQAFLNAKESLDIDFAGQHFSWLLYNQTMEDMFITIENCTISRS